MTKSTQAIRLFDKATGLGDSAGRVRAIRLHTRGWPAEVRWWPDNPPGKSETRIGKRHLASFLLGLAAPNPADAPKAVSLLEGLQLVPFREDPDLGADFLFATHEESNLRGRLEGWVDHLAGLGPADLDAFERKMDGSANWGMKIDLGQPVVSVSWKRIGPLPPPPALPETEQGNAEAVAIWHRALAQFCNMDFRAAPVSVAKALSEDCAIRDRPPNFQRTTSMRFNLISEMARMWQNTRATEAALNRNTAIISVAGNAQQRQSETISKREKPAGSANPTGFKAKPATKQAAVSHKTQSTNTHSSPARPASQAAPQSALSGDHRHETRNKVSKRPSAD